MLEEGNRNCGCNNNNPIEYNPYYINCNYGPKGINAAFGYNTMPKTNSMPNCNCMMNNQDYNYMPNNVNCGCQMNMEKSCEEKKEEREELLKKIKCLNFAIIELGLYLDTHVNDTKALCLYREYTNQLKNLKNEYQKIYGPLSIYFPCKKWRWIEEPWPWEGEN